MFGMVLRPVFDLVTTGVLLVFVGFGMILIATIFSARSSSEKGGVKGGGVIMIGPIPIIFGSDAKWTTIGLALAIALSVLGLLLTLRVA